MHLIHRSKEQAPRDFIPTISRFAIPGHRKTANKRYNAKGEFIGMTKPKPFVDAAVVARVKAAHARGAELGKPVADVPFDMTRYKPLPGRLLLSRGPLVTHEKGVAIPDDKQRHAFYWVVERIGDGVTACAVGDKIICGRGWRPKEAWLGRKFYMAREEAVVGIVESPI